MVPLDDMFSIQEDVFCLILVVSLFLLLSFCLLKYVWEQWHYDVLPEDEYEEEDEEEEEDEDEDKQEDEDDEDEQEDEDDEDEQEDEDDEDERKDEYGRGNKGCFVTEMANSLKVRDLPIEKRKATGKKSTNQKRRDLPVVLSNKTLIGIGKKLRDTFKGQRMLPGKYRSLGQKQSTQKQFAVLYLFSSKKNVLSCIGKKTEDGEVYTDNSKMLFPLDDGLSNYVTARPHKYVPIFKGRHAEELIAGKFAKLVEAYKKEEKEIRCIVLYTWLFPCKDCAADIISKIQQAEVSTNVPIYILYSRDYRNKEKEKEDIKINLEFNRIHVKRVYSRNI